MQRGVQTEVTLIDANARIRELEKRTEVLDRAKGAQADAVVRFDRMEREIGQLRGRIEEIAKQKKSEPDPQLQQAVELLEEKVRFLEERLKQFERAILSEGQSEKSPDVRSEQESYETARRTYLNKKYEEAVGAFDAFRNDFPKSTLNDNALFWQGMSYYNLDQWEKSVLKFEEVRNKFPDGDKAADSTYFEALSFQKMGDKKSARALLNDFKQKFPKSDKLPYVEKVLKDLS